MKIGVDLCNLDPEYTGGLNSFALSLVAGLRAIIPQEKWEDFGAREYFPDVVFKEFEGGHIDFLGNEELLKNLKIDDEDA